MLLSVWLFRSTQPTDVPMHRHRPITGLFSVSERQAVSALVERRRQQVCQRESLLREAIQSLLHPVSPDLPAPSDPGPGAVPRPASRLAGLTARLAWQRVVGARWLVAADLINERTR